MNWFKVLTKSGRRSLAAEAWDTTVTPESITTITAEQITKVLADSDLPLGKAVEIAEYADSATDIVKELFKAAEDKVITYDEAKALLEKVFTLFGINLSKVLDSVKEKVLEKIP